MSDDLREVLAEALEANEQHASASAMRTGSIEGWMVPTHVALAALRQVEQRAFERAAQVLDDQRVIYQQGPSVLLGWSVTQAKIRQLERLAADIRALSTPSLIRESTKGEGL